MRGKWYKLLLFGMSACILTACGSRKPAEKANSKKIVVQETGDRVAETVSLERPNQKVSPKISVERQLQVIIKERLICAGFLEMTRRAVTISTRMRWHRIWDGE